MNSFVFRCKVTAKTAAAQSHNSGKTDTKKMVENKAYAWVATVDGQKRNQKGRSPRQNVFLRLLSISRTMIKYDETIFSSLPGKSVLVAAKKQKSSDLFAILPFSL